MEQKLLKRIRLSMLLYGMGAFLVVLFALSVLAVYVFPTALPMARSFVSQVPYPVVIIDYQSAISYRELAQNMDSVKRFYENQDFSTIGLRVDFSTEEGQKRLKIREKEVLNKMVEDRAIMLLARERGIFITEEMAHQGVTRKLEEYNNQERVKNDLERLYGWKMADFEKKVVLPSLYEDKLRESFSKEVNPAAPAQKKIEQAAEALRGGVSFDDVVRRYSDGNTETGGELGWFSIMDLAPELRAPVVAQKVGVPGSVIESSLGFHIVQIVETKVEESETLYRVRQVFARKETFARWLTEQMRSMSIWVLSPEYHLETESKRIEFTDQSWKKFEEELYQKASGDPSFLY